MKLNHTVNVVNTLKEFTQHTIEKTECEMKITEITESKLRYIINI